MYLKLKARRRGEHGPAWCHSTVRGIVTQGAYGGTHVVRAEGWPVERPVPAIVDPELREKALARLGENKRYSGGRKGRNYLLRGLVKCAHCGTACTGDVSVSSMGYRYHYYSCRRKRVISDKRTRGLTCPRVKAEWLEELVWADVRGFLERPGEVLRRVREQLADDPAGEEDLEKRHATLRRRLAAKRGEKDRYVKLYAQRLIDDEELEIHLFDLKNQVENLKMLVAAVEADLAAKDEEALVARTTEAWLLTLRENLAEVEQDTEGTFEARRELAKLLVERISVSRGEDGRPRVEITYRFGPPEPGSGRAAGEEGAVGKRDSEAFAKAHARGGTQRLLRGYPKMSSYEVAVQRAGSGGE